MAQKNVIIIKNVFEGGKTTTTRERFTGQYLRLLRLLMRHGGSAK